MFFQFFQRDMVVSSGFLDHAAEVYLRVSDSIMSAQPINPSNRVNEWSQQLQQQQNSTNQLNAPGAAIKVNSVQHCPARAVLTCQPSSHPFQASRLFFSLFAVALTSRSVAFSWEQVYPFRYNVSGLQLNDY